MNFSQVLEKIKEGKCAYREGWNGKEMWIHLHNAQLSHERPYIEMKDAQGLFVPWLASQTDILADDWNTNEL